jgi:hypothetical protein
MNVEDGVDLNANVEELAAEKYSLFLIYFLLNYCELLSVVYKIFFFIECRCELTKNIKS